MITYLGVHVGVASAFGAIIAASFFGLDVAGWVSGSIWLSFGCGLVLCYGLPLAGVARSLWEVFRDG